MPASRYRFISSLKSKQLRRISPHGRGGNIVTSLCNFLCNKKASAALRYSALPLVFASAACLNVRHSKISTAIALRSGLKFAINETICPACGVKTPKGKFCLECGASMIKKCSECGTEIPQNGKFCLECGNKI